MKSPKKKTTCLVTCFLLLFASNTTNAGIAVTDIKLITNELIHFVEDIREQVEHYNQLYQQTQELLKQSQELEDLNDYMGYGKHVAVDMLGIDGEVFDIYERIRQIDRNNLPEDVWEVFKDINGVLNDDGSLRRPADKYAHVNEAILRSGNVTGEDAGILREKRILHSVNAADVLKEATKEGQTQKGVAVKTAELIGHLIEIMSVQAEESKLHQEQVAVLVKDVARKELIEQSGKTAVHLSNVTSSSAKLENMLQSIRASQNSIISSDGIRKQIK